MSSSSDNGSDDDYVYAIKNKNGDPRTKVTVKVNNVPIKFTVDTGATIDLIDSHTYQQLQHKITLRKSHTKVYSYGSDTPIKLKGQFQAQIKSKKQYTVSQVHVANRSGGNLLSAKSAQDLGLIQLVNKITTLPQEETETPPQKPMKAKGSKCGFLQTELKFYGLIFSGDSTRPDPERIENLVKVSRPTNAGEVRSFLGMANACSDYIHDYAQISAPLRDLTKKHTSVKWTHIHLIAFELVKKRLTQSPVMSYFDTSKRTMVIVDASLVGISAILAQSEQDSPQYKVIAYASRSLTPVEKRYSQTDREGLALVWGSNIFAYFCLEQNLMSLQIIKLSKLSTTIHDRNHPHASNVGC